MRRPLTERAIILCDHKLGVSPQSAGHRFVKIDGVAVLSGTDPVGRPIGGCPNVGPTVKPCTSTLPMTAGRARFVSIAGDAISLDTTEGLTDGTPPGMVKYTVRRPGQTFVRIED